jgi:hypothetical protein
VEHAAQQLEHPFPWRTAAVAAGAVALVELVALLLLSGVRLAPTLGRGATPHAAARAQAPATPHASTRAPAAAAHAAPTRAPVRPLRPRSRVSILVLNGNGVTGAAGSEAARLLARGYRAATPADAPNHDYARSIVLFAPGYQREGRRLGRDARIRIVGPLDGMRPSQLRGSQLVVILGGS